MGAASVRNKKIFIDKSVCNGCGRCSHKCPFGVFDNVREGYKVTVGGRWGKRRAQGQALSRIFESEEEVLALIERTIIFFKEEGIAGERFADTINRLGFDYVEAKLLSE